MVFVSQIIIVFVFVFYGISSGLTLYQSAKDEIGLLRQLSHVSCVIPLLESIISPGKYNKWHYTTFVASLSLSLS